MYNNKYDFQQGTRELKTVDSNKRRDALKVMASAGVLSVPTYWSKPAVNSVLLPAHALTSEVRGLYSGSGSIITNLTTPS